MPPRRSLTRLIVAAVLASAVVAAAPAPASEQDVTEHRLQAAFLYNFVKFIEWPQETNTEIRLCYLGSDDLVQAMALIDGKEIRGQQLVALRRSDPINLRGCRIVFLEKTMGHRLDDVRSAIVEESVLTVTHLTENAANRGVINLFTERKNLRFQIDIAAAERLGLQISSRLMQIASTDSRGKNQ